MTNTINFATDNLFNELFNDNPQKLQGYQYRNRSRVYFTGDYRNRNLSQPICSNHQSYDDYIHCDERPTHIRVATCEIYQDNCNLLSIQENL